jgi:hypothetical protein
VAPHTITLNLRILIEGYYVSGGIMRPALGGGNSDTIYVELHNTTSPYNTLFISKGVMNTNGNSILNLSGNAYTSNYYLVAYTMNSLKTWSALPITFGTITNYDFTTSVSKAYGNNLKNMGGGFFAVYSGDVTQDGTINLTDIFDIKSSLMQFQIGYCKNDLTGDNFVESADFSMMENNFNKTSLKP